MEIRRSVCGPLGRAKISFANFPNFGSEIQHSELICKDGKGGVPLTGVDYFATDFSTISETDCGGFAKPRRAKKGGEVISGRLEKIT